MSELAAFLLVRAGGRLVGLPVEHVVAVAEAGPAHPVPSFQPALRGVANVRGEMMPVLHLGSLLAGEPCPAEIGQVAIVIAVGGIRLCLEVEEADVIVRDVALPLPPSSSLPWARAVVRRPEGLVPLLDLGALGARLAETGIES